MMSRLHASEDRRKGRDDVIESILCLAFQCHNAVCDSVRSAVRPSQAAAANWRDLTPTRLSAAVV